MFSDALTVLLLKDTTGLAHNGVGRPKCDGYNIIYTNHVKFYKMPYISQTLTKAIKASTSNNLLEKNNNAPIKVFCRSSTITPDLIGLQVQTQWAWFCWINT
jgi:hypothetical protein